MRRLFVFGLMLSAGAAAAVPLKLDYIYPAGGSPGESFRVEVGGNWTGNTVALVCSDKSAKAKYIGAVSVNVLKKSKKNVGKSRYVAQDLPGHSLVSLDLGGQIKTGLCELFIDSRYEVSNPLKFEISDIPELVEPLTNTLSGSTVELASLPVCLNGRVFGKKPDSYIFTAEKDQAMVACFKSDLVPPGGFIPSIQVGDLDGNVITNGVICYFPDKAPVLVFKAPASASYSLLVGGDGEQDGRSAVYRIVFGELPLITGFSPAIAVKGRSVNVQLEGVNLDEDRVRLFTGGKDSTTCTESIAGASYLLPGLKFDLVDETIVAEEEPNNSVDGAQQISASSVVKGCLSAGQEDADYYCFQLSAGAEAYVDVTLPFTSQGSAPEVKVTDGSGENVSRDNNMPTRMRRALQVSTFSFSCRSEKGEQFTVAITHDRKDSREMEYRLRVGAPMPDFNVWMAPVSLNIPINGSCLVDLFVERVHGFDSPVSVSVAYPPLGVLSGGGLIAGDQVQGLVTVWTDGYRNPRTPFYQELVAKSQLNGALLSKPVTPFFFSDETHENKPALFFEKPPARIAYYNTGMYLDTGSRSTIVLSEKTTSEVKLLFKNAKGSVSEDYEYMVIEPSKGVAVKGQNKSVEENVVRLLLSLDKGASLKKGDKGFLIIGMTAKKDAEKLIATSQAVPFSCN